MTDATPNMAPPSDWDWTEGAWIFIANDHNRIGIYAQTRDGDPHLIGAYTPHRVEGLVFGLTAAVENLRVLRAQVDEIEAVMRRTDDNGSAEG